MGRSIGIVGTGVSGLVAAAELHRAGNEVTLFEAADYVGGHTNTVVCDDGAGGTVPVDTGFIVMNDRNYPNFERILAELGVRTQPTTMSFGVSDQQGEFEWSTRGPRGVFAQPRHLADRDFLRMLADIRRFDRNAIELLSQPGPGPSLRRFLVEGGYSGYFIERLLVPQASAVWSADPAQLWDFPAKFLIEFFENHQIFKVLSRPQWRTVVGGSNTYVGALTAPFADRIRLNSPVSSIRRTADSVELTAAGTTATFDDVVLACHSDQALAMLEHPTPAEREVLGAIEYQENETVLHTDTSLMPQRGAAWASWNFHLAEDEALSSGRTTVTYDMNRLQTLECERQFLVTLNRTEAIDPDKIIRKIGYDHPVFSEAGMAAQNRWDEISGADRIHYCGAYWRWGFHEDGCWSGLRVSETLGGRGPGLDGQVPAAISTGRLNSVDAEAPEREAVAV